MQYALNTADNALDPRLTRPACHRLTTFTRPLNTADHALDRGANHPARHRCRGIGHRQAPKLSGGASGGDALGRAPVTVEGPEQPGGELHQPTRQRERAMKGFRTARRGPTVPGRVQRHLPHFRPRRHRMTAHGYRAEMATASPPGTTSPGRRKPPEPRTSTAPEPPSALFPSHLKQVDKALFLNTTPDWQFNKWAH